MSFLLRRVGMLALLALLIAPMLLLAQEDVTISAVGSGIVTPILEEVANSSGATLNVTVTGTNDGFARFCRGESDLVATTRPIGGDEDGNCLRSGVTYYELVIGHNLAAVITHPDNTTVQCLTTGELSALFAPASQATSWAQINTAFADTPISLNIPNLDTATYALLDAAVEGDGFRSDAAHLAAADIVSAVSTTPGAVGVVPLPAALAEGVRIVEVNAGDVGCAAPSAESVESRAYTLGQRLFVYVNANNVEQPGVVDFLNALTGESITAAVESAGFTPATAEAYENDRAVIAEGRRGREFSADVTGFTILPSVSGTVSIGGAASGSSYLSALTTAFSTEYPGVTANSTFEGEQAGIRRLCNGELDMIAVSGALTQEQQDNCAANNITLTTVDLGSRATVLVANAGSSYLTCLTTAEIGTAFNATSTGTISTWDQVRADFPASPMTLFAPADGSVFTDLLLQATIGVNGINREDIQLDDDPLYRAAAVGNVEGALTFMSWADYQRVLDNNQANIQLVGVGENCVQPSAATIGDGSYPITRSLRLLVSDVALSRPEVQSVLWYAASDAQYSLLTGEGLTGLEFAELADLRQSLQQAFLNAQLAAAERAANPEATPEPEVTTQP
ncbi:MAG: substrate-binding domain-containing protein, partial [Anaerolinea sp.]|nr:substrate-binding domain-containing protein [Anaerolinea sp.]